MALGRVYTGAAAPSRRQHAAEMRAYLNEHARRIKYLCLHGVLAVDGVEHVMRRMRDMASDSQSFILDMHEVIGISASAARLLNQARLGFGEDGIAVVCAHSGLPGDHGSVKQGGAQERSWFSCLRGQRPGSGVVRESTRP